LGQVYALLVGINDYPEPTRKLHGCLNDVDHFEDYLKTRFGDDLVPPVVLKDADATYEAVIRQFRTHLGDAGKGDVAVFHYCGHGARCTSNEAFNKFAPDGKDEGIVLYDSRKDDDHYDLADKEWAALVHEVAGGGADVAVILDCCHSGSGTRDAAEFAGAAVRMTEGVLRPRPLETYLDRYYADLAAATKLEIPVGRHMAMAACDRMQTAKEDLKTHAGYFTTTLLEVLRNSPEVPTYAELFTRARARVQALKQDQDPQFDPMGGFPANQLFLGGAGPARKSYRVAYDGQGWKTDCGAVQGLPTDSAQPVTFALHPEGDRDAVAGTAVATRIGAQTSELQLQDPFDPPHDAAFEAELTSLPVPPMPVRFDGSDADRATLQKGLAAGGAADVELIAGAVGAGYSLAVEPGGLALRAQATGFLVQMGALGEGGLAAAAGALGPALRHVMLWERGLALRNPRTRLSPEYFDFNFVELPDGGEPQVRTGSDVTVDFVKVGDTWPNVHFELRVRNRSSNPQPLYATLLYFSETFRVRSLVTEPIAPGEQPRTLTMKAPFVFLPEGRNDSLERFKLVVATEPVDGFQLDLPPLKDLGQTVGATREVGFGDDDEDANVKPIRNDWFVKDLRIRVVRRIDQAGPRDVGLAGGQIVVKAHPSFTADLSLAPAKANGRDAESGADFFRALEDAGPELINFAPTRGDDASVLELTNLAGAADLAEHPLEIEIRTPLQAGETLAPFVFDGQHVLLAGDVETDEDAGVTRVTIRHIPEAPDAGRSLASALKLYFFKSVLKADVNLLRWVAFNPEGGFERQKSGVAEKVAAARNILLLVHGIIGDTERMAEGVQACGLDKTFDLVLAYDYENLHTSIEDTARQLKASLDAFGIKAGDGKRLTILAHSMGGLVSRQMIEREGGAALVDHLVMCGAPNRGSPFGRVEDARRLIGFLATLAANTCAPVLPAVLALLRLSKEVTLTLTQMNPGGPFIAALNAAPDPGVPYTVVAGDIDAYEIAPTERFVPELMAKAGKSVLVEALFGMKTNDIAVGVESILGPGANRPTAPASFSAACHHLNYFTSPAGQAQLKGVAWPPPAAAEPEPA
jgi:hypothetical protein